MSCCNVRRGPPRLTPGEVEPLCRARHRERRVDARREVEEALKAFVEAEELVHAVAIAHRVNGEAVRERQNPYPEGEGGMPDKEVSLPKFRANGICNIAGAACNLACAGASIC